MLLFVCCLFLSFVSVFVVSFFLGGGCFFLLGVGVRGMGVFVALFLLLMIFFIFFIFFFFGGGGGVVRVVYFWFCSERSF